MKLRIEAIAPKDADASKVFNKHLKKAMDETAVEVKQDLQAVTQTWKHKPKFTVRVTTRGGRLGITISTDDVIFAYVNYGTKAHIIRPKRAKVLRFQSGYSAKTRPNFIGSKAGGAAGAWVSAQEVHHPGSAARGFDIAIAKRRQKSLKSRMDHAMAVANREVNTARSKRR